MKAVHQIVERLRPRRGTALTGSIGLHFCRDQLCLAQLRQDLDGDIRLKACASHPFPVAKEVLFSQPRTLRTFIGGALSQNKFAGKRVVTAMPSEYVRIFSVAYRLDRGQSETEAVIKAIKERVGHNLADFVIDYVPVRGQESDQEQLAMIAMSPRTDVLAFLDSLSKAGLEVDALEIGPTAIRRFVQAMTANNQSANTLVITFGDERSFLTMISHRRLLSDQAIDFGEHTLIDKLATTLDLSVDMARDLVLRNGLFPTESSGDSVSQALSDTGIFNTLVEIVKPELLKLVDDIRRAFLFAASETRGDTTRCTYILGSLARWPGTAELLGNLTGMPVNKMPTPYELFHWETEQNRPDNAGETTVATGLALRGLLE